MTASTLTIGASSGTGNITVDNLATGNTSNITTKVALVTNSNISFSNNASAFTTGLQADAGGTIVQESNGAITAGGAVDIDAGSTIAINAAINTSS